MPYKTLKMEEVKGVGLKLVCDWDIKVKCLEKKLKIQFL